MLPYRRLEQLSVKLLPRDKALLRRLAEVEGEAVSVVIRKLIREAAQRRGISARTPGPWEVRDAGDTP